jgi:uncharacterized membrane protein
MGSIMRMTLGVHILLGILGLISGYVALYTAKGGKLHRKSGRLFVYAMLPMAFLGLLIAAVRGVAPALNIPVALLTAYLVVTALTTVRPPAAGARWLNLGALLMALAVGLAFLTFGLQAVANGGTKNGIPSFPFFMFAVVALLASAGDLRMMRSGPLQGASRLARHLWRMCFALFIAALSFFIGQAKVLPQSVRIPGLLALPVLAVLATMFFWLWRVRRKRTLRGFVGVSAPQGV